MPAGLYIKLDLMPRQEVMTSQGTCLSEDIKEGRVRVRKGALVRPSRGPFSSSLPPDLGTLATCSRKSQLCFLPRPPAETTHPLTNCFDDTAICEFGPIQRGKGCHSRLRHPILEKMPSKTTRHGQQLPEQQGQGSLGAGR